MLQAALTSGPSLQHLYEPRSLNLIRRETAPCDRRIRIEITRLVLTPVHHLLSCPALLSSLYQIPMGKSHSNSPQPSDVSPWCDRKRSHTVQQGIRVSLGSP